MGKKRFIESEEELKLLRKTLILASVTAIVLFLAFTFFLEESAYMALGGVLVLLILGSAFAAVFNEMSVKSAKWNKRVKTAIALIHGIIFGGAFVFIEFFLYRIVIGMLNPKISEWLAPAVVLGVFAFLAVFAYIKLLRMPIPKKPAKPKESFALRSS